MEVFKILKPVIAEVPIVISCPHVGTYFPETIQSHFESKALSTLDDTDWFIDRLYSFALSVGIPMIVATHHRWVIDLNRDVNDQPLYTDGRVITSVMPTTDFNGNNLYQSDYHPDAVELEYRIENYYRPYHEALKGMLGNAKSKFGKVLLLDAHSIKKVVHGIQKKPFPDLILGDNNGQSSDNKYSQIAQQTLQQNNDYSFGYNQPFKGGSITRNFGKPKENIHALQIEMAKTNYMDDKELYWNGERAFNIQVVLQQLCSRLIESLI
ncbi:N-formylglutamate amidohydrolase [Rhizosphaericola mali]|uniref:N-formylglutamate deformylase n=1 Tax=Rhizosphaericola mali TaxID=2545455 RepID=A0A5P2G5R7_9BACT|nr:N-formylglutamate amidohydrolase [Rhizosphaericola mali]QES89110.1 N-formylglutamate deformylase [Rhizosphaericola mali]